MSQFVPKSVLHEKVASFQKNQIGIGPIRRKLEEIGQKLDFRVFCS